MGKENCYLHEFGYEDFERVVDMVGGKLLAPITHKMLTSQLKDLEKDNLISRKEYKQIPPKVEYSLTDMGRGLEPIVKELYLWIKKYNFFES